MSQTIVLASSNQGKIREFNELLKDCGIQVVPQSQYQVVDAEETGCTFVENALIKARHAAQQTRKPALADDSGLEIFALHGAPGVYSARYAGEHGNDQANYEKVLREMESVPDHLRQARFRCVLVGLRYAEDPSPFICEGSWNGMILRAPKGDNGFGYDPIVWLPELQRSVAELDDESKNRLSHRAQAVQQLKQHMQQWLNESTVSVE